MDMQPIDIVIHIINIVILYVLLKAILYEPIQRYMQQRSDNIAKDIDSAKATRDEADKLKADYAARISASEKEARQLLLDGSKKAGEEADAIIAQAKTEAQSLINKAQAQMEQQRRDAIQKLSPQISDMAVSLAGQILKREVSESDNQKVIESFFEKEVHQR